MSKSFYLPFLVLFFPGMTGGLSIIHHKKEFAVCLKKYLCACCTLFCLWGRTKLWEFSRLGSRLCIPYLHIFMADLVSCYAWSLPLILFYFVSFYAWLGSLPFGRISSYIPFSSFSSFIYPITYLLFTPKVWYSIWIPARTLSLSLSLFLCFPYQKIEIGLWDIYHWVVYWWNVLSIGAGFFLLSFAKKFFHFCQKRIYIVHGVTKEKLITNWGFL